MWDDLFTALGLMLVIEGIMPFLHPRAWGRAIRRVAELDPKILRLCGLTSMAFGVIIVNFVR
ncbi:MAG: DUF2065 domain-containing protein [Pseudomonadota bacterium]|nr:DUF2065 domain-containing protein [Pseudomonadota bacterium]